LRSERHWRRDVVRAFADQDADRGLGSCRGLERANGVARGRDGRERPIRAFGARRIELACPRIVAVWRNIEGRRAGRFLRRGGARHEH